MSEEKTVTISEKEYNNLLDDADKLSALEEMGVDNWDAYDEAIDLYRQAKKERAKDK